MAYKKSTDSNSLKEILARVKGESVTYSKPIIYCSSDISRAKAVLDRLLEQVNNCEVSSIKPTIQIVEEI